MSRARSHIHDSQGPGGRNRPASCRAKIQDLVFLVQRHVAHNQFRSVGENQGLARKIGDVSRGPVGFPRYIVRFPREREHGVAGADERLVSGDGAPHLFNRLFYEGTVMAENLGLPDKRRQLQRAYYDQEKGKGGDPPCEVREFSRKRGKFRVYLQLLIGVVGGGLLFDKGATLVLTSRSVLLGQLLMAGGILFS